MRRWEFWGLPKSFNPEPISIWLWDFPLKAPESPDSGAFALIRIITKTGKVRNRPPSHPLRAAPESYSGGSMDGDALQGLAVNIRWRVRVNSGIVTETVTNRLEMVITDPSIE